MAKPSVYSSQHVVMISLLFFGIIALLYLLGTEFQEKQRLQKEIDAIQQQNVENRQQIEEKERYAQYLQTPQRFDKEAKIQLGRRQQGEQMLVFVQENVVADIDISSAVQLLEVAPPKKTPLEQWLQLFQGKTTLLSRENS